MCFPLECDSKAAAFTVEAAPPAQPHAGISRDATQLLLPVCSYLFAAILFSQKQSRDSTQRPAEAGSQRREKSSVIPRSICPHVQQLRRNSQRPPQKVGVHAKQSREPLQRRHLPLKRRVAEVQLVLLRQVPFR